MDYPFQSPSVVSEYLHQNLRFVPVGEKQGSFPTENIVGCPAHRFEPFLGGDAVWANILALIIPNVSVAAQTDQDPLLMSKVIKVYSGSSQNSTFWQVEWL